MMKKIKFLGLKIMVTIMSLLAIVDLVSALSSGKLLKAAEANPIYMLTGSLALVGVLIALWLVVFYFVYKKASFNCTIFS